VVAHHPRELHRRQAREHRLAVALHPPDWDRNHPSSPWPPDSSWPMTEVRSVTCVVVVHLRRRTCCARTGRSRPGSRLRVTAPGAGEHAVGADMDQPRAGIAHSRASRCGSSALTGSHQRSPPPRPAA
jgi:hypothetical protein